jgi:hypothetical protein
MYEVALRKMLYVADFYPSLPGNPDLRTYNGDSGSTGFRQRAEKMLHCLRSQDTLHAYKDTLSLDEADIVQGVIRILFLGKGPPIVKSTHADVKMLYHGTTWQNMHGVCATGHVVRGGIHFRAAEGKHGVLAAQQSEQALQYASPAIFSEMPLQVFFVLRCYKTQKVAQLSGAQSLLREHWFEVSHLGFRPCPDFDPIVNSGMEQQTARGPIPANWQNFQLDNWLPLSELCNTTLLLSKTLQWKFPAHPPALL